MHRHAVLPLCLSLCLAACGTGPIHIPLVTNDGPTTQEIRAAWGAPCDVDGVGGAAEEWAYCVAPCPSSWCLDACRDGCTTQRMVFRNGRLVETFGPAPTP